MGRATTQIETRLVGVDKTAAAFASVKRRFAAWDKKSAFTRDLNPFAGFGKTNLAKGVGAGFKDIGAMGKGLAAGAAQAVSFSRGLLGAATAVTALGAALAGIAAKKGIDTILGMDEFGDAAQKIGMTVNGFKRLNTVFEMVGIGGRELTENIIPKMNKMLGETSGKQAIKKIGLSFDALKKMSPEERFKTIGAAIANVSNDLDRAQIETELFGREGNRLDAIWRQGGKSFREAYDTVGNIGGQLDEKGVAAAGRFADAWQVAKMRMATSWQNLMGELLVGVEERFGMPIDMLMMSVFEKASAHAQNLWLEISTNGPIVFQTFVDNAKMSLNTLPKFWDAVLDVMWESTVRVDKKIANAFGAMIAKGVLKARGEFDQAKFDLAVEIVSTGPAQKKLNELVENFKASWKSANTIDLSDQKGKNLEAANARVAADQKALAAKGRMEKQVSDDALNNAQKTANVFLEAVKEAQAITSGSYDAFKLLFSPVGGGAPLGMAGSASAVVGVSGAPGDNTSASLTQILGELKNLLSAKRDSDRDLLAIRDVVEAIGVV